MYRRGGLYICVLYYNIFTIIQVYSSMTSLQVARQEKHQLQIVTHDEFCGGQVLIAPLFYSTAPFNVKTHNSNNNHSPGGRLSAPVLAPLGK